MEIQSRLPIKSLARFKCVSKSWRNVISDRSFAIKHYNRSRQDESFLVIFEQTQIIYRIFKDAYRKVRETGVPTGYNHPFMGCCNGIVCLSSPNNYGGMHYFLLNPALREFMPLPKLEVKDRGFDHCKFATGGYGYDSRSNDFKVVDIQYFEASGRIYSLTHMYKLSTNSWREIHVLPKSMVLNRRCTAFANGFLHWTARKNSEYYYVLTFDIGREVFGILELPEVDSTSPVPFHCKLDAWNDGCQLAAIYHYRREGNGLRFEIWLMMEYGVTQSWTRIYTVGSPTEFASLLANRNTCESLYSMDDDSNFWLGVVDLDDPKKMKDVMLDNQSGKVEAVMYKESMVTLISRDYHKKKDEEYMEYCCGWLVMFIALVVLIYGLARVISNSFLHIVI